MTVKSRHPAKSLAMKVNVFYNTPAPVYYRVSAKYKAVVLKALGSYARPDGEVNLIVTGTREMRRINKRFLNHDYVTDTIAFNYPLAGAGAPFGDIFVCFEQAKKQARRQGHGALKELMIITAHGALHLAGWKDDSDKLRAAMNKKAQQIAEEFL